MYTCTNASEGMTQTNVLGSTLQALGMACAMVEEMTEKELVMMSFLWSSDVVFLLIRNKKMVCMLLLV